MKPPVIIGEREQGAIAFCDILANLMLAVGKTIDGLEAVSPHAKLVRDLQGYMREGMTIERLENHSEQIILSLGAVKK